MQNVRLIAESQTGYPWDCGHLSGAKLEVHVLRVCREANFITSTLRKAPGLGTLFALTRRPYTRLCACRQASCRTTVS